MPDVFDVLGKDHDEVKAMLARLEAGPRAAGGAVPAQLAERKHLTDQLVIEEAKHEAAEEYQQFEELLAAFTSAARAHIAFEEAHAWPLPRSAISAERSAELGGKITAAKKTAPTRPHPKVPPTEKAQKSVGPVAGAADRLRDALSGRGKNR
jgi:hypothetical protein